GISRGSGAEVPIAGPHCGTVGPSPPAVDRHGRSTLRRPDAGRPETAFTRGFAAHRGAASLSSAISFAVSCSLSTKRHMRILVPLCAIPLILGSAPLAQSPTSKAASPPDKPVAVKKSGSARRSPRLLRPTQPARPATVLDSATVEREYNDGLGHADPITVGSITGTLSTQDDMDYFEFIVPAPGDVDLAVTPNGTTPANDPRLLLEDSEGNFIASVDDAGGLYPSMRVWLPAGSYRAMVDLFSGPG